MFLIKIKKKEGKSMFKKVVAIVLSVLMVTSMFTVTGAEDTTTTTPAEVSTEDALRAAVAAAPTDGTETVITLTDNIEVAGTSTITVAAGQNIVINGDYTLTKTGSHGNAFITNSGTLVIEDTDIDLNSEVITVAARAIIISAGSVTLRGSAEIRNGLIPNRYSIISLSGSNVYFTMEDNSKITGCAPTSTDTDSAIIGMESYAAKTVTMSDNAEISGNTVTKSGVIAAPYDGNRGRNAKFYMYGGKIINNTFENGAYSAISLKNDSGTIKPIISGSAQIEGVVGFDGPLQITSAIEYPIAYEKLESMTADGTTDADGDGIVDYYTNVVAQGSDYTLTTDDLEKISIYSENDDYIPCLKASDSSIYIMDADADARDGYTAKFVTKYTVNFYDGDETTIMKTQLVREGQDATPPKNNPTKANDDTNSYIFQNWEDYTNITADRDVYPVFEAVDLGNVYTVIFVDGDGNELKSEQVLEGYSATAPDETPTKTGATGVRYEFREWDTAFDNITADTTVTALFDTYYTVTFKYGLAGGTTSTVEVKEGGAAAAPEVTNPTDWEFAGWDVDLTNITSAITATAQYNYTGDYLYEVSNETELRDAIAIAYTDAENPITIKLLNDIEITSTSTTLGNFAFTNQNIIFTSDNGYNIIKAHKAISNVNWGKLQERAFINVSGGNITFDGAGIDLNRDDDLSNGGRALYINSAGIVTLKNATIKDGGFSKANSSSPEYGMAAYLAGTGTYFIMEEGAKITGFESSTTKAGNLISITYGASADFGFTMRGGEISGNTVNYESLIGGTTVGEGNRFVVRLEGGKIINNTWPESATTKWAYKGLSNNGTGTIYIGTNMEIEGTIGGNQGTHRPRVTGSLSYPITTYLTGGADISSGYGNNPIVRAYNYTLTQADLENIYWVNEEDDGYLLYLVTTDNAIYAREAGYTEKNAETWITKGEATVTFTVTFYNGDGSVLEEQEVEMGSGATTPTAIPTKVSDAEHSYTFSHWEQDYSNITADLSVYPIFIEGDPIPTYTVTFYNGDNETVLETQIIEQGKAAVTPTAIPTKADEGIYRYTFSKWTQDYSNITADLSVYPEFTESVITYNVKFCDSNSVLKDETVTKGDYVTAPEYTAVPEGYAFKGWALEGTSTVVDIATYTLTGDTVFVPVLEYTVTFNNSNGEKLIDVESVGGLITPPEAPEAPENMVFKGWALEGTTDIVDFTKSVTPETIFVPIYTDAKSIKIFTIGHSYGVDANWLLPTVLREAGYNDIKIGMVFAPGCDIRTHYLSRDSETAINYYKNVTGDSRDWKTMKDGVEYDFGGGSASTGYITTSLAKALADEDWDIIVMQQSPSQSGKPDSDNYDYLDDLITWVNENKTNPDAKLAWHLTWANENPYNNSMYDQQSFWSTYKCDEGDMYNGIIDTVKTVIEPTGEFDYIIPVGTVVQNMRSVMGNKLTRDSYHLHLQYGRYPAALTWAKVLCGVDIDKIDYIPGVDEYTDGTVDTLFMTDEVMAIAKEAINNAVENPYSVTMGTEQIVYPEMTVDFGTPVQEGDNYKYTATVYLENYGLVHGIGAVDDGTAVTETGNYAGTKIKDWNIDIEFDENVLVSAGEATSSLKLVGGYEGGNATYIAPDMTANASGATISVASTTGDDPRKAYPYYGITRDKIALGTVEFTTTTNIFNATLSGDVQWGITNESGAFVDITSRTTFSSDNASGRLLMLNSDVLVGTPEGFDNADDGLVTSEAELREALSGALSTDASNPTEIILGADIILDDGAATADDLTDGTLTIEGTSDATVYVNISGAYTIKNMQEINTGFMVNVKYATVNITDTVFDANYGNDNACAAVDDTCGIAILSIEGAAVTLNGTATLKNGYKYDNSWPIGVGVNASSSKASFKMNDNSKITGCRDNQSGGTAPIVQAYGNYGAEVIMNGGEISGNVLTRSGAIQVEDSAYPVTLKLNAGKIINNDTSRMCWLIGLSNGSGGDINGANMTFDEGKAIFKTNHGSLPIRITGKPSQTLTYYTQNTHLGPDGGARTPFVGNGYVLTYEDLNMLKTDASFADNYYFSRVLALNTAENKVYSYTTIDDVSEGLILADGTVVGEVVIVDSITGVTALAGELTVSYQTNPNKTVTGMTAAAIYKGTELIDVNYDTNAIVTLTGENNTGSIKLDVPSDWATNKKAYTIKFFIWDPATIAPQINVLEYKAQ